MFQVLKTDDLTPLLPLQVECPDEIKIEAPSPSPKSQKQPTGGKVKYTVLGKRERNNEASRVYRSNKRRRIQDMEKERNELREKNTQLKNDAELWEKKVETMKALVYKVYDQKKI